MTALLCSCLIFFFAGLIQGLTGFGGGLVAIPLLCLFMDIKLAVPLSILNGLAITAGMSFGLRRIMDRRKILPLLIGSLPGVLAGTFLLKMADPTDINRMLGILLIAISVTNLTIRLRPLNLHAFWGYVAGFFSGTLTASVGAGGPPAIIYSAATGWKKDEIRATLTGFFVLNGAVIAVVHSCSGVITHATLTTFAATLLFVLLGTFAGSVLSGRINRLMYLRIVYLLLAVLGIMMLAR
jgi:Predicted permeases